ncbi:DUF2948 family protein [Amaricoccus sp.]|uniref:DUF2948 family protein n=1 Tax=Amaricoccus sp. TaxID=1872485 RepID=UPI001B6B709E|nr:DUF2948 family protein [Amaricoccus sp.]MBP7241974.1 DUF2948 family protein [Amaricoccus sp.]
MAEESRGQGEDARFEDGAERPLRLAAETAEDLGVLSALVQDALAGVGDVAWTPKRRKLTVLLRRFRWEDAPAARRQGRPYERVQSILTIADALRVRASGVDPADHDTAISVLSIGFEPSEDGAGVVRLILAGDGEIAVDVECLDVALVDVSQPYLAQASRPPSHDET